MSQGTAPKRSIDEIIGSIRSIMDRTEEERAARQRARTPQGGAATQKARHLVANDDASNAVPDDLTDLADLTSAPPVQRAERSPAIENYAEPVARRLVEEDPIGGSLPLADDDVIGDAAGENESFDSEVAAAASPQQVDADQMAEIAAAVSRNLQDDDGSSSTPQVDKLAQRNRTPATFGRRRMRPARSGGSDVPDDALRSVITPKVELVEPVENVALMSEENAPPAPDRNVVEGPRGQEVANDVHDGIAALHDTFAHEAERDVASELQRLPSVLDAPVIDAVPVIPDPVIDEAMMRPIIREWLDDNLPPLVERLVREELERAMTVRR